MLSVGEAPGNCDHLSRKTKVLRICHFYNYKFFGACHLSETVKEKINTWKNSEMRVAVHWVHFRVKGCCTWESLSTFVDRIQQCSCQKSEL